MQPSFLDQQPAPRSLRNSVNNALEDLVVWVMLALWAVGYSIPGLIVGALLAHFFWK